MTLCVSTLPSRRIPAGPGAGRLLHAAERQPGTGPQQLLRAAVAARRDQVAALETKDAGDWLAKADKAYQDGEDQRDVDQLAYLTNQRIELAKQTIVLRNAEAQLQNAPPSAPRPASTRAPRNWTSCVAN